MTIIIIIAVVAFLWWSLVPAKTQPKNLDDLINQTQKEHRDYSNVYKTKLLKEDFYYSAIYAKAPDDVKVFSGTKNECSNYVFAKTKQ